MHLLIPLMRAISQNKGLLLMLASSIVVRKRKTVVNSGNRFPRVGLATTEPVITGKVV